MPRPEASSASASRRLLPQCGSKRPATGPATKAAIGSGNTAQPASSGLKSSTSCRRWLNTSSMPSSAAAATRAEITAVLKPLS
ncbi:hypothetical protein D3C72_2041660 [compost metagenome]